MKASQCSLQHDLCKFPSCNTAKTSWAVTEGTWTFPKSIGPGSVRENNEKGGKKAQSPHWSFALSLWLHPLNQIFNLVSEVIPSLIHLDLHLQLNPGQLCFSYSSCWSAVLEMSFLSCCHPSLHESSTENLGTPPGLFVVLDKLHRHSLNFYKANKAPPKSML